MYYRRRLQLGIIEKSAERLSFRKLEKLLFLLCDTIGKDHYSFYPTLKGCSSFVCYQDYNKLVKDGYLQGTETGEIVMLKTEDYSKLKKSDQQAITKLLHKFGKYSENELSAEIEKKYPDFTRLKIVKGSKQEKIEPYLTGKGYEGMTIDSYMQELIREDIRLIIDVRKNPVSMKYNFNKKILQSKLLESGISYVHLPELGIPANLRKKITNREEHIELLNDYEAKMLDQADAGLDKILKLQEKYIRVALLCFEKDAELCHRTRIIRRIKK